jgi:hypothetical protein
MPLDRCSRRTVGRWRGGAPRSRVAWHVASRWTAVQRVRCGGRRVELRVSVAAGAALRRWTRPHRGLPASWCTAARSRPGPGGCAPAGLWTSVAGTTRAGEKAHARAWWGWRSWVHPLGARAPRPLPDRGGVSFDWSFTGGLGAARAPYVCRSSRETPGFLLRDMAVSAAAVEGPWTATRAPAGCCGVFSSLEGHAR